MNYFQIEMKKCNFSCNSDMSHIEQDNVRIYPEKIIFAQAYDSKEFKIDIQIINCGFKHALIKLCAPKSKVLINL